MIHIQTIPETASTNADMLIMAAEGAPEGQWLRAERQTSGKGRMGREWASPAGNLYASGLVRLRPTDPPAPTLAFVAAVALENHLRHVAPDVLFQIKWPNDVLVDGAKVSGILLERAGDAVVIGIGVNLASHPDLADRKTTSLTALTGDMFDPNLFLLGLAGRFAETLDLWRIDGLRPILSQWATRAHPTGTSLSVSLPDGNRIEGLFDGLTDAAALRLRLSDGEVRILHAGDVFLLDASVSNEHD